MTWKPLPLYWNIGTRVSMKITWKYPLREWMLPYASHVLNLLILAEGIVVLILLTANIIPLQLPEKSFVRLDVTPVAITPIEKSDALI